MTEKEAIQIFKHWIEYEKGNKEKINNADELIEIQETILKALEQKDKELKKYKENALFLCDPDKNKECKKTSCYINGGECELTTDIKFRKEREG